MIRAVELALNLEATEKHVERVSGRSSLSGASSGDFGDGTPATGASGGGGSGGPAGGEALHVGDVANHIVRITLDKDIESIGNKCVACCNVRDALPRSSLHPWEFPAGPWKRLHADFAQLFGKYNIIVVDAHSKWLEAEEIRSISVSYYQVF
ncbi:unnamed protein product, partial [Iphiclides podalirius]